jgi:hypothetical protein
VAGTLSGGRAVGRFAAFAAVGLLCLGCGALEVRPTETPLPTPGIAPVKVEVELAPIRDAPPAPEVLPTRGPTPTAWPGTTAPPTRKVRLVQQVWLVEEPRADATRVLPIGAIAGGVEAEAIEVVGGWVRIDPGPFTGWAPLEAVQFEAPR